MFCKRCSTDKHKDDFAFRNKAKDLRQYTCRSCQKAWKDKHYLANKKQYYDRNQRARTQNKEWLTEYKQTLSCQSCGESHIATLDFHHTDPKQKDMSVSAYSTHSRKRLLFEISKCVVLCANCHRKLHWDIRNAAVV